MIPTTVYVPSMRITEVHPHPCRYGWLVTIELQGEEYVRMSDTLRNAQAEEWFPFAVPSKEGDPTFTSTLPTQSPMKVFVRPPGSCQDEELAKPTVGDYKIVSAIDPAAISAAVGWWVARLRGEDDLRSALHEYDVTERMGKAQGVVSRAAGLLRRKPLPEKSLQGFEADLRKWLRERYLRDEKSCVPLQTDYEPCWPPLYDLAQKYQINGFRFPWKTLMQVFQGKVVVNGDVIYDGNETPVETTEPVVTSPASESSGQTGAF